jgi:hypothetical protein
LKRTILLLAGLAIGLAACTHHAPAATKPTPAMPTMPAPRKMVEGTGDEPDFTPLRAATPRWASVRSDVGGLPVPRGWRLVERKSSGYVLDETYVSPVGVTLDEAVAWYLALFPEGKTWGGWIYCRGIAGSGDAGWYVEPENWAWRSPTNADHLIQIGLRGEPKQGPVSVNLYRSEFGLDCME